MDSPDPMDVSIVTAVYDVARYLPDFFGSLRSQEGVDLSRVEIIAVDDGSTDDSPAVLERYRAEFAEAGILPMTILHQENAGQGSARNNGMRHARGRWVTFTDPDDTLEPQYLASVLSFADAHPDVEMVATHRVMHDDATGEITDNHPLRWMFERGEGVVDLDASPHLFHGSAPAAFFRRSRLEEQGRTFDHRVRPNFEDGHFCTRYLLACPEPLVGFLRSAVYNYRKRSDGSSTLQGSNARPERYVQVPRYGYLDVLEAGTAHSQSRGRPARAPEWVQNFVLYELTWYFGGEDAMGGSATAAVGAVAEEFLDLLRRIRTMLDDEVVAEFRMRWVVPAWRQILLHGLSGDPWVAPVAVADRHDPRQRVVRVSTRFIGPEPRTEYLSAGRVVEPVATKLRRHVYFDSTLLWERISWVTADAPVRVRLDGELVEVRPWWPAAALTTVEPTVAPPRPVKRQTRRERAREGVRRLTYQKLAAAAPVRRRYAEAWVLMDRLHDADDSGEHLFVWLRENRPEVNAWFTIESGTPDWTRLKAGPHGDRVVAHGSHEWRLLMLNCRHLVSSHIDVPVHRPPDIVELTKPAGPQYRFTFLQHGVIKDDLSRWLNPKEADVFVTSTVGEYESIAGDGTSYSYTAKETRLTGLPRFDRLYRLAQSVPDEERNLILVAPTWRHWLLPPLQKGSQRREVRDDFLDTDYARNWLSFLTSDDLREAAERNGLTVAFLPHPNLQSVLPMLDLPPHVVPFSFEGGDIQRLFVRAATLVTDYSSMAFNSAYVDRPVVYFQFDADLVLSGGHVGRAGYFDYERVGFGPVTFTASDAVKAVVEISDRGSVPSPEFAKRIEETFVLRDGRCCERVADAVAALDRPVTAP